jgi:hypothetical protein
VCMQAEKGIVYEGYCSKLWIYPEWCCVFVVALLTIHYYESRKISWSTQQ